MKLESLKNSKFDAFEENELNSSFKVLGGAPQKTAASMEYAKAGIWNDCIDHDTKDIKAKTGTGKDANYDICEWEKNPEDIYDGHKGY